MPRTRLTLLFTFVAFVFSSQAIAQEVLYAAMGGGAINSTDGGAIGTVDQQTGEFTSMAVPFPGRGLTGLAIDSSQRMFATVADNGGVFPTLLIELDIADGSTIANIGAVERGGDPVTVVDMDVQPGTNQLFIVSLRNELMTVDSTTAEATLVGVIDTSTSLARGLLAIAFAPDGTLYVKEMNGGDLATLDPANAAILDNYTYPSGLGSTSLGVRPSDGQLFMAECCNTGPSNLRANDVFTGVFGGDTTIIGSAGANRRVQDFAFTAPAVEPPLPAGPVAPVPTLSFWSKAFLALVVLSLGLIFGRGVISTATRD